MDAVYDKLSGKYDIVDVKTFVAKLGNLLSKKMESFPRSEGLKLRRYFNPKTDKYILSQNGSYENISLFGKSTQEYDDVLLVIKDYYGIKNCPRRKILEIKDKANLDSRVFNALRELMEKGIIQDKLFEDKIKLRTLGILDAIYQETLPDYSFLNSLSRKAA